MGNSRFKFRIWNSAEMHYNDFVVTATGYVGKITEEFLGSCVFNQEDLTADKECILMQCTGLKDKNGKLIYEGDIVKYVNKHRSKDFNAEIKYLDNIDLAESDWLATGYFCVDPNSNLSRCDILTSETALDYEVIGNIYENKELLNE